MRVVGLAVLVLLTLSGACKNEPRYSASSESAAVDRGRLCADGGATLDLASNQCACPAGATWTGIRCEGAVTQVPELPAGAPPQGMSPEEDPEPAPDPSAVP